MKEFKDKVVIVTGASSGIGVAIAKSFAAAGAKTVLAARRETLGKQVTQEIIDAGGEAVFVQTDVSKAEDVENLVNTTIKTYGKLDIAINNAGVTPPPVPLVDIDEKTWDETIDINLKGVFLCLKYQIPQMMAKGGSILIITSLWATGASQFPVAHYTASKHGAEGLTKAAALEYAKHKIRLNSIATGWIHKEGSRTSEDAEFRQEVVSAHPLGYLGDVEDVAAAALYLSSDSAKFVTGHTLKLDSGISINMPVLSDSFVKKMFD